MQFDHLDPGRNILKWWKEDLPIKGTEITLEQPSNSSDNIPSIINEEMNAKILTLIRIEELQGIAFFKHPLWMASIWTFIKERET